PSRGLPGIARQPEATWRCWSAGERVAATATALARTRRAASAVSKILAIVLTVVVLRQLLELLAGQRHLQVAVLADLALLHGYGNAPRADPQETTYVHHRM